MTRGTHAAVNNQLRKSSRTPRAGGVQAAQIHAVQGIGKRFVYLLESGRDPG